MGGWYPPGLVEPTHSVNPALLERYEGLVKKTSSMYVGIIRQMDFEDICQVMRLRVWKALEAWDPNNAKTKKKLAAGKSERELRDAFIFGCVRNQAKDLVKRNKTQDLYIDDLAGQTDDGDLLRDRFEFRYLQEDAELVFQEAEEADPLIPNTLSHNERLVLICAYLNYNGPETAERLGIGRRQVASTMRTLREKMSDWRPDGAAAEMVLSDGPAVQV